MRHTFDTRGPNNESDAEIEDQGQLALYKSSFGGYSYYPTTLFKRRASPPPLPDEGGYSRKSCSPRRIEISCSGDRRDSSQGNLHVKGRRGHTTTIATPLLGRYRQEELRTAEKSRDKSVERVAHNNQGVSGPLRRTTPDQERGSSKPNTSVHATTERALEQQKGHLGGASAGRAESRQQQAPSKKRVSLSCPPAIERIDLSGRKKTIGVEKKKETDVKPPPPPCPESCCIHSHQSILDYVDLQRELRDCHDALRGRDAELEDLQSQLRLTIAEKTDLESRCHIEIQELEVRHAANLAKANEDNMEWQRRVLSDQLASYEESREELEKVRAELEQERLNHARTRSELNEAQSMCQALNQRLEWAHDTQNVSVTRLSTRSSPSKGMREDHLSEGLSPTSMLVTPTPRRQPPPIPQPVVKEEEGTFRTGVSTFSFVQEQQVPSYQDCSESAANHATVDNVPANSTINISDPSISPSATFDLDVSGVPSLLGEAKQGDPPRKTQEEDNRVCSGGAQRDMEEWTEGDGRPSSSDTRSNTHTTLGVQTTGAVGSSSSTCGKSFLKAICDAAVSVHPSKTHPFEQLAGQEALLCKELLRALLDKEKQLAELTSQQVGQKKEEKGKLAFMPE